LTPFDYDVVSAAELSMGRFLFLLPLFWLSDMVSVGASLAGAKL
jgi:hypothetical protein